MKEQKTVPRFLFPVPFPPPKTYSASPSYTGLTPSEFSSGDTVCKGHITHQGNKRVRRVLNQAAWAAIKKDRDLKTFFERLYPRTGKKKAIVAVARKLIGRIRAAFKTGKPYLMNPIEAQTASS